MHFENNDIQVTQFISFSVKQFKGVFNKTYDVAKHVLSKLLYSQGDVVFYKQAYLLITNLLQ